MKGSKIDLFERFGICSEIIRYFGYSHNSFLFMSKLDTWTREMLDINYDAMMNCISNNRIENQIDNDKNKMNEFLFHLSLSIQAVLFWSTQELECKLGIGGT